jgi:hypothetical protein
VTASDIRKTEVAVTECVREGDREREKEREESKENIIEVVVGRY